LVVLLCAFLLALPGVAGCREDTSHQDRYGSEKGAWLSAQRFVKEKLESPGTADFGDQGPRQCVKDLGQGRYRVAGWVSARDRFGDAVRLKFAMVIEYAGKTKWRVLEGPVIH